MQRKLLFLLLLIPCFLRAQTITKAEYFWDTDPGVGKGIACISFAASDSVVFNQPVSLAGLSNGTHLLYFRTSDNNGVWSLSEGTSIFVLPQIVAAEYFWDIDQGIGSGTPCTPFTPSDSVAFIQSVSLAGITGTHVLYFRTEDASGVWSLSEGTSIFVLPAIIAAEYFWDIDPGIGSGTPCTPFTPSDSVAFIQSVSLPGVTGTHVLYFRTEDASGVWSLSEGTSIFVVPPIIEAEYFWDTDHGIGSGTPCFFPPSDSISFNQNVSTDGLLGSHILYFRTEDATGAWSLSEGATINIVPIITGSITTPLCAGSSLSVPYDNTGQTYNADNIFTAQLSDATGSFSSPTSIGAITSTSSGSINAVIPSNVLAASGYRIRVVSSDPVETGSDNGSDITINNTKAHLYGGGTVCAAGSSLPGVSVALIGTAPWNLTWSVNGNSSSAVISSSPYALPGIVLGTYTLTALSDNNGCVETYFPGSVLVASDAATIIQPASQILCNGAAASVNFTGASGTVCNWTNDNTSIGLAASGTGNIGPFTASNTGASPNVANITVSPVFSSHAYIGNGNDSLYVYNTTTYLLDTTILVGNSPAGVAVSLDGSRVYVCNQGDNTVSAIDATTYATLATIPVGSGPGGIVVTPDGAWVYTSNLGDATVSVINASTLQALSSTISIDMFDDVPCQIAVSPDGNSVYVPSYSAATVISTQTNSISGYLVGAIVFGTAAVASPDGRTVYETSDGIAQNVGAYSTSTGFTEPGNSVEETWGNPGFLALTPDGSQLYVATHYGLVVINTAAGTFSTISAITNIGQGIAVSPDGSALWITGPTNTIVLSTADNATILATLPPGFAYGNFIGGLNCAGAPLHFSITVNNTAPTATLSGGGGVCADATSSGVSVALTGTRPWSLTYTINGTPTMVNVTSSTSSATYTIPGITAGTYTITAVSDACSAGTFSGNATVTVNALPTATASSNTPVPFGFDLDLTSSGGVGYSWMGPDFNSMQQNPVISNAQLSDAGIYTVTVTGVNGCTATATRTAAVSGPELVCMLKTGGAHGAGTMAAITLDGLQFGKIHDFDAIVGDVPYTTPFQASNGLLYGMTQQGGADDAGVLYSFDPVKNSYTRIFDFTGLSGDYPGNAPVGSLMQASNGLLYGMTSEGGVAGAGVLFSFDPANNRYTDLYEFDAYHCHPQGGLIQSANGLLYGMALSGGSVLGEIFSFDPANPSNAPVDVHEFDLTHGGDPTGSLVEWKPDNQLYGMTELGGANNDGVLFSFDPISNSYNDIYDFNDTIGAKPHGSLVQSNINGGGGALPGGDTLLYGLTSEGGANNEGEIFRFNPIRPDIPPVDVYDLFANPYTGTGGGGNPYGDLIAGPNGALYFLSSTDGNYGAVVTFNNTFSNPGAIDLHFFDYSDGASPTGSLMLASNGLMYGTTPQGGSADGGVLFSIDPNQAAFESTPYTVLVNFNASPTGNLPLGNLKLAGNGLLYGMTYEGGANNAGVVFTLNPLTFDYNDIYDFDYTNGANPYGSLILAKDGLLYGMTTNGGNFGAGTIFSIDPSTNHLSKLSEFNSSDGGGENPTGDLMQDTANGLMYGMTQGGGANFSGTLFSFDPAHPANPIIDLLDFSGNTGSFPGAYPQGSLIQDSIDGKLYGMTRGGGANGYGVIFNFDPSSQTYKDMLDFDNTNGAFPFGSLLQASNGKLYGMTSSGGNGDGLFFSFDPANLVNPTDDMQVLNYDNGASPIGSFMRASNGKLYGMTSSGGLYGNGTMFDLDPSTNAYTKIRDLNTSDGIDPAFSTFLEIDSATYSKLTVNPNLAATLNLKMFIQGYYMGGGIMTPALHNEGIDPNPNSTNVDTVTVSLVDSVLLAHDANDNSTDADIVATAKGILQTNGALIVTYPRSVAGNKYYIMVTHRNAVQTWSANTFIISNGGFYDFTTAANKAYRNNMISLGDGNYAFYSGDINQNGGVDAFDFLILDPDIISGNGGYLVTDLNGSGGVDAFDFLVLDPNIIEGIGSAHP